MTAESITELELEDNAGVVLPWLYVDIVAANNLT